MTPESFLDSLQSPPDGATPPGLSGPLLALWLASRGDWDAAHAAVQDGETREDAWVHAHLHRMEGDLGNAGYWYSRAGRPRCSAPLEEERMEIARALTSAV